MMLSKMLPRVAAVARRSIWKTGVINTGRLSYNNVLYDSLNMAKIRRVISTTSVQQSGNSGPGYIRDIPMAPTQKLLLDKYHEEIGAKFTISFGFKMPLTYEGKQFSNEVLFTRKEATVFDASYRPQIYLRGKNVSKIMETMVTSDIQELKSEESVQTLMTNPQGGIIDDLVVTKLNENELFIIANTPRVVKEIQKNKAIYERDVQLDIPDDMTLLTFQGPECSKLLQLLILDNVRCLPFMHSLKGDTVFWTQVERLIRCSDTGEDGFMVSLTATHAEEFIKYAVSNNSSYLMLIGLQAREALRIEAGHCLSGVDYNEKTTPLQAKLDHLIGKRRRVEGKFPGADIILKELNEKSNPVVRIGFLASGSCGIGASIMDSKGNVIGNVTSACFSPCLQQNIGIGYVATEFAENGKELLFDKNVKGRVAEIPLVKHRSYTNVNLF